MKLPNQNLSTKVTVLIVAILIGGFGLLVLLNIRDEMRDRIEKHKATARLFAASMVASSKRHARRPPGYHPTVDPGSQRDA